MFNIQLPKALAFPAVIFAAGALQATAGYFATRRVTPAIIADQAESGNAQSLFLAVSCLYTIGSSAAINQGARSLLKSRLSLAVASSWGPVAFVAQMVLIGSAIYYARYVVPADEQGDTGEPAKPSARAAAKATPDPAQSLVFGVEAAGLQAKIDQVEAASDADLGVTLLKEVIGELTGVESTLRGDEANNAQNIEDCLAKLGELRRKLYSKLHTAFAQLNDSSGLETQLEGLEELDDADLVSGKIESFEAVQEPLLEAIKIREALPADLAATISEEQVTLETDRKAFIEGALEELENKLDEINQVEFVSAATSLNNTPSASGTATPTGEAAPAHTGVSPEELAAALQQESDKQDGSKE